MTDINNQFKNVEMKPVDFDPFAHGEILITAPATEAQKEIWASVQMGPEANCAFNESMSIQVRGNIDGQVFNSAMNDIIVRHEALRTTFSPDGTVLSINKELLIDVPVIDLSGLEQNDRNKQLQDLLIQEVVEPFDLEYGPLVRSKIIKLQEKLFRILITAHHIICDGWAMAIVMQDLGKIYSARIKGFKPELPTPCLFSDYAIEDKLHFNSESGYETEKYWISQYNGAVPVLDFPTIHTRPLMRTFNARRFDYQLSTELVKNLKKTGAKAGCTFITVLIAGYKSFLHRITGQEDLIVGTPAAGQSATGRDALVGHCVNLLPIRSQVTSDMAFSTYLKTIRNLMFDAYEYQRYTFGKLIPKLDIPRNPGRIPLVPIIFNIDQKTNEDGFKVEGIESDIFSNHRCYENFEMFLNVTSSSIGDKVVIECTYNSNLFDEETIDHRMKEFEALLFSITENPDQKIGALTVMHEAESQKVLIDWNETFLDYPKHLRVHNFIEEHARVTPEKCAASFEGNHLSYGELNTKASQLSNYLSCQGLGSGNLIGICMERSISMIVGLLGILKSGAAYVPLDPEYPIDRINYMINDARLVHIVTQSKLQDKIISDSVKPICIDTDWDKIVNVTTSEHNYRNNIQPDSEDMAYVIYTSGSTGNPKGVNVPHRALTNFLLSMKKEPGLSDKDVLLAVTTLSFDIAGLELFLPLVTGATVVLVSRETSMDGNELIKSLEENKATVMQATPSTWRMMIDAGWKECKQLKILCGGEAFPRDLAIDLVPKCREVWNMYGPTETTIWSVICKLDDPEGPILIGRPIGNTRIYILDKNMNPVPIGVAGELYIAGDGVSHGYINRPDLTEKNFIQKPFGERLEEAKLYKTGDLCRYHYNGKIEYLNRLDNQIKLRGFRIELGEIEAILKQHEFVKQAIAVCKEVAPGDTRLAAYIIPNEGQKIDEGELRSFLRKSLPTYMIPQHFISVTEMPLTPAGKIDRKKLQSEIEVGSEIIKDTFIAPETATEIAVAQIWKEVLKLDNISKIDNFFDIGGHSLLAARVITRINREFNQGIKLGELFQRPTIERLSLQIDTFKKDVQADSSREMFEF